MCDTVIRTAFSARTRCAARPANLDSMGWLNVIFGFQERFSVGIPEADYATLIILNDIAAYLSAKRVTR
jgi:acyl carrier protein